MKVRKVFRPSRHSEPIYEKTDKKGKAGDKKKDAKPNNDSKNKTPPDKTQPRISTKTPLSRAKAKLVGTNSQPSISFKIPLKSSSKTQPISSESAAVGASNMNGKKVKATSKKRKSPGDDILIP